MHAVDFLSSSPKLFIFQKETSKTNFGGILFLIYIIIMISISLAYIVNYAVNDKYTYEIKMIDNTTNNEQVSKYTGNRYYEKLNEDVELNPLINFTMVMTNSFGIYDLNNGKYLEGVHDEYLDRGNSWYNITRKVSDLELEFRYICGNDSNCSLVDNKIEIFFVFAITGYKLDHQADIPFQIMRDDLIPCNEKFGFELNNRKAEMEFDWEVIKYKDQKSIFDSLTNVKRETIYDISNQNLKLVMKK